MYNYSKKFLDKRSAETSFMHYFHLVTIATPELFGGKIKVLLDRAAARDLYDVHNLCQSIITNPAQ